MATRVDLDLSPEILARYQAGQLTVDHLSAMFGASQTVVVRNLS